MQTVFNVKKSKRKGFSQVSIFVISIISAIFFGVIYKSELLLQTDVLSQTSLSLVKTYGSNKGSLFLYVLNERIWIIPILFLFSTTYLAGAAVYTTLVWYGISLGMLWAIALLRYGMMGSLFLVFSGLPQYLLYVPAMIITMKLCCQIRIPDRRFYLQLFVLESVVFLGVVLETFVNVLILKKLINILIGV